MKKSREREIENKNSLFFLEERGEKTKQKKRALSFFLSSFFVLLTPALFSGTKWRRQTVREVTKRLCCLRTGGKYREIESFLSSPWRRVCRWADEGAARSIIKPYFRFPFVAPLSLFFSLFCLIAIRNAFSNRQRANEKNLIVRRVRATCLEISGD